MDAVGKGEMIYIVSSKAGIVVTNHAMDEQEGEAARQSREIETAGWGRAWRFLLGVLLVPSFRLGNARHPDGRQSQVNLADVPYSNRKAAIKLSGSYLVSK